MNGNSSGRSSGEERSRQILRVLLIEFALNILVAAVKIAFGLATRCMVIVADGIHSLSDGASNIIGFVAMSIAAHPADKTHPYGHRKYETIASFIVAFALFFAAITIIRDGMERFIRPTLPEVNAASFAVMGGTLVVNAFIAWWERRRGRELESDLLIADSWHTFSDVFVTLSVFAALLAIELGVQRFDSAVSIGIGLFIGWIALRILMRSSDVLSDRAVLDEERVKELVLQVEGVRDCHEIRSRGRPDEILVDLHILVDPRMTVEDSHRLANLIERNIRRAMPKVRDVLVHVEPLHHDHHELEENR